MSKWVFGCVVGLLAIAQGAQAEIFRCENATGQYVYQLAIENTSDGTGIAYASVNASPMRQIYRAASTRFSRGTNGTLNLFTVDPNTQVDWSRERSCYKVLRPTLAFGINLTTPPGVDEYAGVLRVRPHVVTRPGVPCTTPAFDPGQPVMLTCRTLR